MNKAYEPKFNYILNDLALSNLITRNLYSKDVTYDDKRELENQIELIQQENQQLKDNWNKLKEKVNEGMRIYRNKNYDLVFDIEEIPKEDLNDFISYLAFQVMEQLIINIEQGSDSDE